MTCPLVRSRTAVTVVVQGWPVRGCTRILVPTSWAGSEAAERTLDDQVRDADGQLLDSSM